MRSLFHSKRPRKCLIFCIEAHNPTGDQAPSFSQLPSNPGQGSRTSFSPVAVSPTGGLSHVAPSLSLEEPGGAIFSHTTLWKRVKMLPVDQCTPVCFLPEKAWAAPSFSRVLRSAGGFIILSETSVDTRAPWGWRCRAVAGGDPGGPCSSPAASTPLVCSGLFPVPMSGWNACI